MSYYGPMDNLLAERDKLRADAQKREREILEAVKAETDKSAAEGQTKLDAFAANFRFANRNDPISDVGDFELVAVEHFVLEEDDRVRIADRGFQQTLRVSRVVRRDHDEAGYVRVPR